MTRAALQTSTVPTVQPQSGLYDIEPELSGIAFTSRHLFGLGKVAGTFKVLSGRIAIADRLEDSTVEAEVDAASFYTGLNARDRQVRSAKFLDVAAHPTISFRSTGLDNASGRPVLQGSVTAKGQSAPFAVEVTRSSVNGDVIDLVATTTIDRYALGVTAMKGMAGRYLHITVNVHATRRDATK